MVKSSSYSALSINLDSPLPTDNAPSGPRIVPILPYKHASKWNSAMYKHHEPFTVIFDTYGMSAGYGVKHGDFATRSAAVMSTIVVRGGDPVCFPTQRKIQFRIVVGSIRIFEPLADSSPDVFILQWPGYDSVDFSAPIDIHGITVSELAGKVASLYTEYFKVRSPLDLIMPPLLTLVALSFKVARQHRCTVNDWTFTLDLLETLRILGIRNVYDNVYQAEVVVG
jgi:hypothetical protein